MSTFYELLDIESGMPLREFDTLDEALRELRHELLGRDPEALLELALLKVVSDKTSLVAMETEL